MYWYLCTCYLRCRCLVIPPFVEVVQRAVPGADGEGAAPAGLNRIHAPMTEAVTVAIAVSPPVELRAEMKSSTVRRRVHA